MREQLIISYKLAGNALQTFYRFKREIETWYSMFTEFVYIFNYVTSVVSDIFLHLKHV